MYHVLSNERWVAHRSARFKCFVPRRGPLLKGVLIREKEKRKEERRREDPC